MFDCGNSKTRGSVSRANSVRESCRKVREPRRCIERDALCDLIDELRYSSRPILSDRDYSGRNACDVYERKRHKRHESNECEKDLGLMTTIRLDGGSSSTSYLRAPKVDLGTADEDTIDKIYSPITNNCLQ